MNCRLKSIRLLAVGLALWAFPAASSIYANVSIFIAPHNGETIIAMGDTVTFDVLLDVQGVEQIVGYEIYLTMDPAIFKPLLYDVDTVVSGVDTTVIYRPFNPGNLIALGPALNNTHRDIWSDPYVDLNDIAGFQMDYFQYTPATPPSGQREYFSSGGLAASFQVVVVGLPSDPSGLARINFDYQYAVPGGGPRETQFFRLGAGGLPTDFFTMTPLEILVAGLRILPAIPDTVITPGSSHIIYLSDHFTSGLYDSSQAVWNVTYTAPSGATVTHDPLSEVDSVYISTTGATHGIIDLTITLDSPELPPLYTDSQPVRVIVDYPPVFDQDLSDPLLVTFDEDTQLPLAANADIGGVLFTDLDDAGSDLTIWLEPDSPVRLNYDDVNTVTFYADTNRFGVYSRRLFVEDALGISTDTLLVFTINSINDPPVVSFDSVSVLGDTLVIHRATPDTLDLKLFVADVDDPVLTWSVNNPDPVNLSATTQGDLLLLLADTTSPFVDIDLIITATDDSSATGSDTLVVSIRSWPPEIGLLPEIKILAGTPDTLSLNELVSDNDTHNSSMTWSFEVVDFGTGTPDDSVIFTYNSTTQTVIFNTPAGYYATDLLRLTVEDDDNNTDTDSTRLTVFATLSPVIYPLDTVVVFRNTSTQVLDLDDYVVDPIYEPEDINWSYSGGDSLQEVRIDPISHVLTLVTDPNFFGYDSVTFIATNPDAYSDTAVLVVRVIPRYDGPPVWQPLQDAVENVHPYIDTLFVLSDMCKDDFTPGDQLIFTGFVNPDPGKPLNLNIDPTTLVASISVSQPDTFTTWLCFSATDALDSTSYSDTITVFVKDSYSPVWSQIPPVSMYVNQTNSERILADYLSDRDTPLESLTITFVNPNSQITVTYDSVTTRLTIQAKAIPSESWITFYATDPSGNTATTRMRVVVNRIIDVTPPDGGLSYFYNPAADKWIHFVLVGDSTTDRIWTTFTHNSRNVELLFTQRDSLPGTLTWIAPYRFENAGDYILTAELIDNSDIARNLYLLLAVNFSKSTGDLFTSPDQQLTVSYPPVAIPDGKLLIVSEEPLPERVSGRVTEIIGGSEDPGKAGQAPATVYSLDSNLPEPILVTITYDQPRAADPYFAFYRLDGDELLKIDTYANREGRFEAVALLGQDVIFDRSDTPAGKDPLPDAELFCYPNPFNATLQVRFLLRQEDRGRIVIYNLLGKEVFTSPEQPFGPGVHLFSWRGTDNRGLSAPSGIYFIRLVTDRGPAMTRKVTLLK